MKSFLRAALVAAISCGLLAPALAADVKISALPAASALDGTEPLVGVQSGVTVKITPAQISTYVVPKARDGVLNVRLTYGGVPDGSTNNNTAIANAFAAANAFTNANGSPTVYFDCDPGTTTCQYNYNGSGTSPVNPLVPMTILCAPGVTLNYSGTAHAIDVGPSGLSQVNTGRFAIQGCRFAGGANYTAGIYVNDYISNVLISENEFWNFGNQTGYSIVFPGNNWTPTVSRNYWRDTDGFTKNMVDAHSGTNVGLLFVDNKNECETSGGGACSVATTGVGVWTAAGWVTNNEIKYHYPAIRIGGSSYQFMMIAGNVLEGNNNGTKPAITFGTPGGTGVHINQKTYIINNGFYWPNATGNPPYLAPETAGSGSYTLDNLTFANNHLQSNLPSGVSSWINTGSGGPIWTANNFNAVSGMVTQASATPLTDRTGTTYQGVTAYQNNGTSMAGRIPVGDSTGVNLSAAFFHDVAAPMLCSDVSASGTAQSCNTSPKFNTAGSAVTPVAGDMILYKTTTTNTGALTLAVNGASAANVKKFGGASALSAGDIISSVYYPLVFDGTNWEVQSYAATSFPVSAKTSNYTVTAANSGTHFDNTGAAGEVDFTLPAAASGLNYCFSVYAAQTLKVIANTGDKIAVGASNSATTGNITNNAVYGSVCLEAHGTGQWIASTATGAWTVN